MSEMKESVDIKEGEHLKEVLTSVEKKEPIDPTTAKVTKLSEVDTSSPPATMTTAADASPPNLEERAAKLRGSKEEQIVDRSLIGSKEGEEEIKVKDKITDAEPRLSQGLDEPYTIFWQDAAKSWTDFYIESARNVAEATGYWLDLFSKPWKLSRKDKDKAI